MTEQKAPDADQGVEGDDRTTIQQEGETIVDSMTEGSDLGQAAWVAAAIAAYEAKVREVSGTAEVLAVMEADPDITSEVQAVGYVVAHKGLTLPDLPTAMRPHWAVSADYVLWAVGELVVTVTSVPYVVAQGSLTLTQSYYVILAEDAADGDGDAVGDVHKDRPLVSADDVSLEGLESASDVRAMADALGLIAGLLEDAERGA